MTAPPKKTVREMTKAEFRAATTRIAFEDAARLARASEAASLKSIIAKYGAPKK